MTFYVMERDVRAIDGTFALLGYLRRTIELTVDPVEMLDKPYEFLASCGCDFLIRFDVAEQRSGLMKALRGGDRVTCAEIEVEACAAHRAVAYSDHPQNNREWNGFFMPIVHDRNRKAEYEGRSS